MRRGDLSLPPPPAGSDLRAAVAHYRRHFDEVLTSVRDRTTADPRAFDRSLEDVLATSRDEGLHALAADYRAGRATRLDVLMHPEMQRMMRDRLAELARALGEHGPGRTRG